MQWLKGSRDLPHFPDQSIAEAATVAIVAVDSELGIRFANAAAMALLRQSQQQLEGQDLHAVLHRSGKSACGENCALLGALQAKSPVDIPGEALLLADGSTIGVRCGLNPSVDKTGMVVTLIDTTAQLHRERELIESKRAADQAARTKDQLLANSSREMRTPLTGMVGITTLLLDSALSAEQREWGEAMQRSASSLLDLSNDLFDLARIGVGGVILQRVSFDPVTMLQDLGQLFAARAAEKGIALRIEPDQRLPRALLGDPGRLRQILLNLISNALQYTEHGEVSVNLAVVEQDADHAVLEFRVRDTGIGFDTHHVEEIFQAYALRDDSVSKRTGGRGLGLSLAQSLLKLMGSCIEVQSEPGKGSNFGFRLSLQKSAPASVAHVREPGELRGRRCILLSESQTHAGVLEDCLGRAGMLMHRCADASEMRAAKDQDLAIFDFMTLEAALAPLRDLRATPAGLSLPSIVIAASAQRGDADTAQNEGYSAYLARSDCAFYLLDLVALVLRRYAADGDNHGALVTRHTVAEQRAQGRPMVLIAEDNAMNQKLARALLMRLGCDSFVVENGQQALDALKEQCYDLVLMDCQMPVMDGLDATRAIRRLPGPLCDVPIVAITANAMTGDRERCLEAGMNEYITKPVAANELAAALATFLPVRLA